jgi:hypothetical protein
MKLTLARISVIINTDTATLDVKNPKLAFAPGDDISVVAEFSSTFEESLSKSDPLE